MQETSSSRVKANIRRALHVILKCEECTGSDEEKRCICTKNDCVAKLKTWSTDKWSSGLINKHYYYDLRMAKIKERHTNNQWSPEIAAVMSDVHLSKMVQVGCTEHTKVRKIQQFLSHSSCKLSFIEKQRNKPKLKRIGQRKMAL